VPLDPERLRPGQRVERALELEPRAAAERGRGLREPSRLLPVVLLSASPAKNSHFRRVNGRGGSSVTQVDSPAVARTHTVLVVDDEPSLRLLCRVNLELEGFRVVEAGTLRDARAAIERDPPDAVLLDVHIAGEDGRDLLEELRAADSPAKVVMLTGSVDVTLGRFDAADEVVVKPFEPLELVAIVRRLVGAAAVDSTA
jgi:CheY-like chemotaxis protein